jgi:hypothetical protein
MESCANHSHPTLLQPVAARKTLPRSRTPIPDAPEGPNRLAVLVPEYQGQVRPYVEDGAHRHRTRRHRKAPLGPYLHLSDKRAGYGHAPADPVAVLEKTEDVPALLTSSWTECDDMSPMSGQD